MTEVEQHVVVDTTTNATAKNAEDVKATDATEPAAKPSAENRDAKNRKRSERRRYAAKKAKDSEKSDEAKKEKKEEKAEKAERPRRARRQRAAKKEEPAKEDKKPEERTRQERPVRQQRSRSQRKQNLSNVLTIGTRLDVRVYVKMIKALLNENKHQDFQLLGYQASGMSHLTRVVNILTEWGYVQLVKIRTNPAPCLKITIKRTENFQEKFDDFAKIIDAKRAEYLAKKGAEEKAATEAKNDDAADQQDQTEAKENDAQEVKA